MHSSIMFEQRHTPHYTLLQLTAEKYEAFLKTASDEAISNLMGIPLENVAAERKKAIFGFRTHNKSFHVFIIIDTQTEQPIGYCGFHTWYLEHDRAEIGYGLYSEAYKGKGVMSEVFAHVIAYGFNELKLQRIEAFISPDNQPSIKLVEKFNFTREGQLRHHYFKQGQHEDSVVYSLLSTEYHYK